MKTIMEAFSNILHESDYTWIMAYLPKEAVEHILKFSMSIPEEDLYISDEKMVSGRDTTPHITILANIHTQNENRIKKALKKIKPFAITLDKMSLFEKENYDVLKIDIRRGKVHQVHKFLKENLKNSDDFPNYKPHATVAYLKKGMGQKYLKYNVLNGAKIQIDCLSLEMKNRDRIAVNL